MLKYFIAVTKQIIARSASNITPRNGRVLCQVTPSKVAGRYFKSEMKVNHAYGYFTINDELTL